MIVEQLVPARGDVDLDSVLAGLQADAGVIGPFADETVAFFAEVGRRLTSDPTTAAIPDLRALAFWMRRSHLVELKRQFESLAAEGTLRLPRGIVFHLPPGNVDTIFMYSWLLAALCGNRNIVRLPTVRSETVMAICATLNGVLGTPEFAHLRAALAVIGYPHDVEITTAISAHADVRVIWGGDATVARVREIPLPPRAVELTFADRYSIAAIDARAYLDAGAQKQSQLAEDFVSDTYPFDQAACSSPQIVVWSGSPSAAEEAAAAFFPSVAAAAERRGYGIDAGIAMAQTLAAATLAADGVADHSERYGRHLMVVDVDGASDLERTHVGGGFLLAMRVDELADLAPYLRRSDQTLTQFGYSDAELRELVRRAAPGGGLDRIVPFGQALTFDRFWDGYDLLAAFTRAVRVTADPTVIG
jgi:Acyl-CoA reductase (LuxC)